MRLNKNAETKEILHTMSKRRDFGRSEIRILLDALEVIDGADDWSIGHRILDIGFWKFIILFHTNGAVYSLF